MKILKPGHKYELENFESPKLQGQEIQFIEKEQDSNNLSGPYITINDGCTTEEVLKVLINRNIFLQRILPCKESEIAVDKMEEALMWLNKRTEDRLIRKVEGKHIN